MKHYVVGFVFSPNGDEILLIRKNRPDHLAGKLNGIGGKVEQNERPREAILRETQEEAGLTIIDWIEFDIETDFHDQWVINYFYTYSDYIDNFKSMTDEVITKYKTSEIPFDELPSPSGEVLRHLLYKLNIGTVKI